MTPATLRLRTDSVEWRHVEDEIVALTSHDDRYLGVNRTGALLWRALSGGSDLAVLADIL